MHKNLARRIMSSILHNKTSKLLHIKCAFMGLKLDAHIHAIIKFFACLNLILHLTLHMVADFRIIFIFYYLDTYLSVFLHVLQVSCFCF